MARKKKEKKRPRSYSKIWPTPVRLDAMNAGARRISGFVLHRKRLCLKNFLTANLVPFDEFSSTRHLRELAVATKLKGKREPGVDPPSPDG